MSATPTPTKIYYAWVTTWNTTPATGTDAQVYISHELVEMITDPDANTNASGWTTNTFCPGGGSCELADNCEVTAGVGNYTSLTGVNCWSSSYYSNKDGGCVIPGILNSTNSANTTFTYGGGKLLNNATICLIFAGTGTSAWAFTNSSTPTAGSADDIKRGVQTLLTNSQFYNLVTQYGVNKPKFSFAAINSTTSIPNNFQEVHIQQVVKDSINAGAVPNPASNTDPIIFVVVVNNTGGTTPKYITTSQIGNHGTFQFTPAPPTNIPTTNPPGSGTGGVGPTSPGFQSDQFGITQIYPSKTTGNFSTAWFLPSSPNSDTRHVVDSTTFSTQADLCYRNTQTNVTYNIAQSNGFTEASLVLNQATLATQYFMQDNKDWTNIEMTLYARVNTIVSSTHSGPASIVLAMRGAKETNDSTLLGSTGLPKSCEAADYRVYVEPVSGNVQIIKDLQYTAGLTPTTSNPQATSPIVGLANWQPIFVGIKAIVYNLSDGKSVAIEVWMDSKGTNTWTQILRYVDVGNWPITTNNCSGTAGQTINWGGPLAKFIWNNISSIDIKWASIREIDVYALNPQLLVPPSTTTPPATTPGNTQPPLPPPANQPPPTTPKTGILDKFGVKEFYPTLSGGQTWYLSNKGLKADPRVSGIPNNVKEYINGDGSFHLSTNSAVEFFVSTTGGYSFQGAGGLLLSHLLARVRQYIFNRIDWKNVEVTIFHNIEMVNKTGKTFDFGIKCRTGSHSRQGDCQGCAYEIQTLCLPGSEGFRHRKEQWHDSHCDDRSASFSFSSPLKRWVGEKFINYNIVDPKTGHVTGVRLEHWWNDNGDGVTWTKVNSTTDIGGWGFLDAKCGGNPDEVIIWGGPLIGFFWHDFANFSYKWMSIREIDTAQTPIPPTGGGGGSGGNGPPGGPPTPSPIVGPPPAPPKTAPLIGPNAYNVLKIPYSVIVDDSGGCTVGVDPNAHLGETQLGTTVPGTGNVINCGGASGKAYIGGQQIQSTSSLLYNKVLAEFSVQMKLSGLPADSDTNLIHGVIFRGSDKQVVVDFGSISPAQLTSQFQTVTFKTPTVPNYSLQLNDVIGIYYVGGDSSNFVILETDNTSGFDGAFSVEVDVIVGSTTINTITGLDIAASYWSTGQTGIAATYNAFYNVSGAVRGGSVGFHVIGAGGTNMVAEAPVNGSSALIGQIIYEIDVWLLPVVGSPTGTVSVYLLQANTGTRIPFGSLDASTIPVQLGSGSTQYSFFNYSNVQVNDVNTHVVVEYSGGDISSNAVGVVTSGATGGTAYDGTNTAEYESNDGVTWNLVQSVATTFDVCMELWTSSSPPPGTQSPGTGTSNSITIPTPANAPFLFFGGLEKYFYTMAGMVANDPQSKLIGLALKEIDIDLKQLGTNPGPGGTVMILIFNFSGAVIGSSAPIDVSQLPTTFTNFRFKINFSSPGYTLKQGDMITVYYAAVQPKNFNLASNVGIGVPVNVGGPFDSNHTLLVTMTLGSSPRTTGRWLGLDGGWQVHSSWAMCMTIYT